MVSEDNQRAVPLGVQLGWVNHLYRKLVNTVFQRFGLTPGQPPIMHYLSRHDGCIQRELAEQHHYQAASISTVLDAMEASGLVERRRDSTDRRVYRVFLTEKGREANATIERVFDSMEAAATEDMTPEERQQLDTLLRCIAERLQRLEESGLDRLLGDL